MLEKLRKKAIKRSLPLLFISLIGVVLVAIYVPEVKALLRGSVAFETLAPDEIKERVIVDAAIDTNFGAYLEEYETNTKTHVSRTTDLYYVIWTGDEYAEDFRYIGIKVPAKDKDAMEAIAEATYNEEYSDPIYYSGALTRMSDEEYRYFEEYFTDGGWTKEEVEEYTLPYYINVGSLTGASAIAIWVLFAAGLIIIAVCVILFIRNITGGSLKKLKKQLAEAGVSEYEADAEYESAKEFQSSNQLRIGKRMSFFIFGAVPGMFMNSKVVWAYQSTTTHRTNGIKTGTTYSVIFMTEDKKKYNISVNCESEAQEVLQYVVANMPWAVVGYDNDLVKMYRKDYQKFLDLRYNQTPKDPYAEMFSEETMTE